MALTRFQRKVCRFLAERRIASGESYIAGGAALNEITGGGRISRDLDLFHDTRAALAATWTADQDALRRAGLRIEIVQERPAFVEALVRDERKEPKGAVVSPLKEHRVGVASHSELGATLHPFDLATNKVLARNAAIPQGLDSWCVPPHRRVTSKVEDRDCLKTLSKPQTKGRVDLRIDLVASVSERLSDVAHSASSRIRKRVTRFARDWSTRRSTLLFDRMF